MNDEYFVVLNTQHAGKYTVMTDEDGVCMAIFPSYEAAIDAADNNILARACGFEIFMRGEGRF